MSMNKLQPVESISCSRHAGGYVDSTQWCPALGTYSAACWHDSAARQLLPAPPSPYLAYGGAAYEAPAGCLSPGFPPPGGRWPCGLPYWGVPIGEGAGFRRPFVDSLFSNPRTSSISSRRLSTLGLPTVALSLLSSKLGLAWLSPNGEEALCRGEMPKLRPVEKPASFPFCEWLSSSSSPSFLESQRRAVLASLPFSMYSWALSSLIATVNIGLASSPMTGSPFPTP